MNFKENEMYQLLLTKLNSMYKKKNNIEDKGDYIMIYNKSMAFYVEPYEYESNDNTISVFAGLLYVDTYNMGEVRTYNDFFQIDEKVLKTEEDVDDFIEELTYLVKTCDADKRVTNILKMFDKIDNFIDRSIDFDFLHEAYTYYFN